MTGAKKAPVVGALSNSAWARIPLRVPPRDAVTAGQVVRHPYSACNLRETEGARRSRRVSEQENPPAYSRILAEQPFTLRGVKPRTSRCASLNWPDALARVRSFWGKFLGQSVGALWLRIFNVNPSKTHRLASSSLTNSELAA